jgi:hypothetical protein
MRCSRRTPLQTARIFERDGTHQEGKRHQAVFRADKVFARQGTRSERWGQDDIRSIKRRRRADADRARDQEAEAHLAA